MLPFGISPKKKLYLIFLSKKIFMASILDFLNTPKGEEFITKASEKTSEDKDKITAALGLGFPILLGAMKNNISSAEGKESLNDALQDKHHNEEIIANIKDIDSSELIEQGEGILGHVLGSNEKNFISVIAGTLQIKESSAADVLKMAAPLLMSILSTQKKRDNIDVRNIETLIDSVMGSSAKFDPSLVQTFLKKNKEGNVIDDVTGMIFGGKKKGKNNGSTLGGMLGGK